MTFLILRVQPLALGACRSFCGVAASEASQRRAVSTKRPNGAPNVSCSDLVRRSVRFGLSISGKLARQAVALIGLPANNCASTAAASRNVVDLRSSTPQAPTQELAPRTSVPTPTASRGWKVHSPFFLQCKGKGVNGQRRRESQADAQVRVGHFHQLHFGDSGLVRTSIFSGVMFIRQPRSIN